MKAYLLIGLLTITALGLNTFQADAQTPTPHNTVLATDLAQQAAWFIHTVDSNNTGSHISIAGSTTRIYVSYYDETAGDLRVAYSNTNGNCGPDNTWQCTTVDSAGDVGQYSSIAINPVTQQPAVAYYDVTNTNLKYVTYSCIPKPAPIFIQCLWSTPITIDSINNGTDGKWASLKIGTDGVAQIAYHATGTLILPPIPYTNLRYAKEVGSGGNCGPSNDWQCDIIDVSLSQVGQYASLALNSTNKPYIAYYREGKLGYAWMLPTGDCGPSNSWKCKIIDDGNGGTIDVGKYASLSFGDIPHIAYYDATNKTLKHAAFADTGSCPGGSGWDCDTIDTIGDISTAMRAISVAANAESTLIAYYDKNTNNGMLKIAQPQTFGNCGPTLSLPTTPPLSFKTWSCQPVDTGLPVCPVGPCLDSDVGAYAAITRDDNGLAAIAYFNHTTMSLKVAYQRMLVNLPLVIRP